MLHQTVMAAAALLALTRTAQAARQITPPVRGEHPVECKAYYAGSASNQSVTVELTTKLGRTTRVFKVGPSNRLISLMGACETPGNIGYCEAAACAFTYTVPSSDISGSISIFNLNGSYDQIVLPSR